jgi:hypothetical protein
MAKTLGPKSRLIRESISAHPDKDNAALAEFDLAQKRGGVASRKRLVDSAIGLQGVEMAGTLPQRVAHHAATNARPRCSIGRAPESDQWRPRSIIDQAGVETFRSRQEAPSMEWSVNFLPNRRLSQLFC